MSLRFTGCTCPYCGCSESRMHGGAANVPVVTTEDTWDEARALDRAADDGWLRCADGAREYSLHQFKPGDLVVVQRDALGGFAVEGWGMIQSQIAGQRDLYWVTLTGDLEWKIRRVTGASQVEGARLLASLRSRKRVKLRVQRDR